MNKQNLDDISIVLVGACVEKISNLKKRIWAREYRPRNLGQSSHAPCTSPYTLAAGCTTRFPVVLAPVAPGLASTCENSSKITKPDIRKKYLSYKLSPLRSRSLYLTQKYSTYFDDKKKEVIGLKTFFFSAYRRSLSATRNL